MHKYGLDGSDSEESDPDGNDDMNDEQPEARPPIPADLDTGHSKCNDLSQRMLDTVKARGDALNSEMSKIGRRIKRVNACTDQFVHNNELRMRVLEELIGIMPIDMYHVQQARCKDRTGCNE